MSPPASRPGLTLNQKFLTAVAVALFALSLLAMPVLNVDELSARFGQSDWLAVWELSAEWQPQWKYLAMEWIALAAGYTFLFRLFRTEHHETQSFDWLKRSAQERERRRHARGT